MLRIFKLYVLPCLALLALLVSTNAATYYYTAREVDSKVAVLQRQMSKLDERLTGQVLSSTKEEDKEQVSIPTSATLPVAEVDRRQAVRTASQDELLTEAVAKVTPAVVSIVISKDVPQLEVVYENPFGDDPFFHDFGIRVPTYRQKGTVRQKVGGGTGFIVRHDGYIVTNKHVVQDLNASYTALLSDGAQKEATVLYRDPSQDIAVIKIEGSGYSSVSLGDSGQLKLGQTVIAIGNALAEYNNSVSVGIISGLNRTIEASGSGGVQKLTGVIQTDAAINPGNSGGPLLDLNGKVMGVNVATVSGSNSISFSIPVNEVKKIIDQVVK